MSLLCFGEALIDFLSNGGEPETFTKFPGGAPANVSVAYAKLGEPAYFSGMLGKDMFGDFLLQSLAEQGVDTRYCHQTDVAKTALAFVCLDQQGERSFSFYRPPAADLLFRANDFSPEAFQQVNIFHICSNSLTDEGIYQATLAGLALAREHQCIRSFDINLRLNLWQQPETAITRIWQIIARADVLKFSREELEFLCDHTPALNSSQEAINHCLSLGAKLLVLTDGPGAITFHTPLIQGTITPPATVAVDTTAAGDAFVGGLLFALNGICQTPQSLTTLLANGEDITRIIEFGSRCGAFAVTRLGAFPSLPTKADLHQLR